MTIPSKDISGALTVKQYLVADHVAISILGGIQATHERKGTNIVVKIP
jgi:hypothetical protein